MRTRSPVPGVHAERVCSRVGRVEAATDPEPRRKRHRKDTKRDFSPLTHRDCAHAPPRQRRQPNTRRPRGVERQSRRNDPPGARRRRNRSNGAAPTEFGPKIIAGVPADRADARSRSTTTSAKQIDADVVEPTSWDPRAATLTKRRRRVRRDRGPRRRRRSEPVRAEGRPPPGARGAPLCVTLNAAARRAESTRRPDGLRTTNGRSATAAGRLTPHRRVPRRSGYLGDWITTSV